jgi:hypothetical protein
MKSELAPEGDLLTSHDQVSFQPAAPASYEDAFNAQRQKVQRLNEYYDQVVAELLVLLNECEKEAA